MKRTLLFIGALAVSALASLSAYAFDVDGLSYEVTEGDNVKITGYTVNPSGVFEIPATVENESKTYNVVAIDDYVFYGCGMTELVIPNSVTTLGEGAFYDCDNLTTATIGNSVTALPSELFCNCDALTTVSVSASVTEIASDAFKTCKALQEINVASGNTAYSSINGVLFNGNATTLIYCPRGFQGDVMIPETVTSIDAAAFNDPTVEDYKIKAIYCKNPTPIVITAKTFTNEQRRGIPLYVPTGSLAAYKAATGWGSFDDIREFDPNATTGVESIEVGGVKAERARYDLSGAAVSKDYKGVVVIVYSDGSHAKALVK